MPWAEDELAHLNGYGLTYEVRASGLYLRLPGRHEMVHDKVLAKQYPGRYFPPKTVRTETW